MYLNHKKVRKITPKVPYKCFNLRCDLYSNIKMLVKIAKCLNFYY